MSQSVAALVHGFATHDPRLTVGRRRAQPGGQPRPRDSCSARRWPAPASPSSVRIPRDDRLTWRDRHLGLVPVAERPSQVGGRPGVGSPTLLAERCDLGAVAALAAAAPPLAAADVPMPEPVASGVRLAVAGGPAFSFTYPDNLEALAAAGAELVPFDPCSDAALPEHCHGLVAGGGFPEVFAEAARRQRTPAGRRAPAGRSRPRDVGRVRRAAVAVRRARRAADGGGHRRPGPDDGSPHARLPRSGDDRRPPRSARPGRTLRGHEFHYSITDPAGDLFVLTGRHGTGRAGFGSPSCVASYLHVHLAGRTQLAADFVRSCSALRVPYKG